MAVKKTVTIMLDKQKIFSGTAEKLQLKKGNNYGVS